MNKSMKAGFTILEILMGIVLFSLVGGVLFQSMGQIAKVLKTVNFFVSGDMRSAVVAQLLERDLAGACVPQLVAIKTENDQKNEQKSASSYNEKEQKKSEKKEQKKLLIPHVFTYEHDGQGNLQYFTFITVNPAVEYATAKQRPVRVIYTLGPDKEHEGALVLYRKEVPQFMDQEAAQPDKEGGRKIVVVAGIKKCACEFGAFDVQEEENQENKQQSLKEEKKSSEKKLKHKQVQKKFIKADVWNANQEEPEGKKRTLPLIPEFVRATLSFVHNDTSSGETILEISLPTLQAAETVVLEGIQPVSTKTDSDEKIGHLFDEERLSDSLGDKLNAWTSQAPQPQGSGTVINVTTP